MWPNKATVDGRFYLGVQFAATVYNDEIQQCGTTWRIDWKFHYLLLHGAHVDTTMSMHRIAYYYY